MAAYQQSPSRDSGRNASGRPTRNGNAEETALDPTRASFGLRGRRDEEGVLFDPPRVLSRAASASPQPNRAADRGKKAPVVEAEGFSVEEMARIIQADKALGVVYSLQDSVRSGLSRLYAELATFNPFPAAETVSRFGQWLRSGFGLLKTPQAAEDEEREDVQSKISSIVAKAKSIHTKNVADAETRMREEFKGRTFLANGETPRLLKHVSIPVGKTHVPYETLQQDLRAFGVGGTRIKVSCPSDERTIVYRKRPDNSWESLELSWRQPGKVDIIRNGIKEAHLFNEDALKAAKLFAEGHKVSFKRKKVDPNTVWQVI